MLYLVEHFSSIQGEGRYIGESSIFFRFGGCNLQCKGFGVKIDGSNLVGCDTLYAVDKKSFVSSWIPIDSLDILVEIYDSYKRDISVVITGGEPLLNITDPIFNQFIEFLVAKNIRVTIETNGTFFVDFQRYPFYKDVTFALSIKLSNSLEPYSKRVKKDAIKNIITNAKESFFKFATMPNSQDEIASITKDFKDIEIFCMSIADTKEMLEKNAPSMVEFCQKYGYRYSDRLHLRIWDNKRGV